MSTFKTINNQGSHHMEELVVQDKTPHGRICDESFQSFFLKSRRDAGARKEACVLMDTHGRKN